MRLAVTGMSVISSLGYDVANVCAAQRAGIVRPREIDYFISEDEEGKPIPVIGHPIMNYGEGFIQTGAWVCFSVKCLKSLISYSNLSQVKKGTVKKGTVLLFTIIFKFQHLLQ